MDLERIKEIQQKTSYPESISVMLALKQVWNECEQEKVKKCSIPDVSQKKELLKDFLLYLSSPDAQTYTKDEELIDNFLKFNNE
jgi:hypothetical protein